MRLRGVGCGEGRRPRKLKASVKGLKVVVCSGHARNDAGKYAGMGAGRRNREKAEGSLRTGGAQDDNARAGLSKVQGCGGPAGKESASREIAARLS